ncbi:HEPN domain-containing protein [Niallia taxi]|uniref:Uncharacterized protein n=1 Tax=Niallia taxi TaxID=2499688 RepID=A0A437K481_9BACI|nr:HEPN domain-containing protein [Niallia taxi]RVT57417.1 hypothetical protein EM808_24640 [Niallia taxi]
MNLSFLKESIIKICKEIEELPPEKRNRGTVYFNGVSTTKEIFNNETYEKTLSKLLDEKTGLSKVVSYTMIAGNLNKIINNNLDTTNKSKQITDDIQKFSKYANNTQKHSVYIPIKGLDLFDTEEVYFSPNIKIHNLNMKRIIDFLTIGTFDDADVKYLSPTMLEVSTETADIEKSGEFAIEIGKYIVNFFRLADFFGWNEENLAVRLPGFGGTRESMRAYIVKEDSNSTTFTYQQVKDLSENYELDDKEYINYIGYEKFGHLLQKNLDHNLGSMDKSILRALTWFGESKVEHDLGARFVKLTLAVETLLNSNDSDPITATLRDRTAFILGKEVSERIDISKEMSTLYKQRSGIVHHGKSDVDLKSLLKLESYTADLIRAFLTDKDYLGITDKTELHKQIEKLKFKS